MAEEAESTLRALGERGDIVKRMHRARSGHGIERGTSSYVLAAERNGTPVVGRLLERGLDDELSGTAYAVVDGIDGLTHHIRLHDLEAIGDSAPGSIVELRRYEDARGRSRAILAICSDLAVWQVDSTTGSIYPDRTILLLSASSAWRCARYKAPDGAQGQNRACCAQCESTLASGRRQALIGLPFKWSGFWPPLTCPRLRLRKRMPTRKLIIRRGTRPPPAGRWADLPC